MLVRVIADDPIPPLMSYLVGHQKSQPVTSRNSSDLTLVALVQILTD